MYYKEYSELYSHLYIYICQSEYIRKFIKLLENVELKFEDVPFIEINKTKTFSNIKISDIFETTSTTEKITDNITKLRKKELCDLIILKGEYASQKLLKLAVRYRYAYDNMRK